MGIGDGVSDNGWLIFQGKETHEEKVVAYQGTHNIGEAIIKTIAANKNIASVSIDNNNNVKYFDNKNIEISSQLETASKEKIVYRQVFGNNPTQKTFFLIYQEICGSLEKELFYVNVFTYLVIAPLLALKEYWTLHSKEIKEEAFPWDRAIDLQSDEDFHQLVLHQMDLFNDISFKTTAHVDEIKQAVSYGKNFHQTITNLPTTFNTKKTIVIAKGITDSQGKYHPCFISITRKDSSYEISCYGIPTNAQKYVRISQTVDEVDKIQSILRKVFRNDLYEEGDYGKWETDEQEPVTPKDLEPTPAVKDFVEHIFSTYGSSQVNQVNVEELSSVLDASKFALKFLHSIDKSSTEEENNIKFLFNVKVYQQLTSFLKNRQANLSATEQGKLQAEIDKINNRIASQSSLLFGVSNPLNTPSQSPAVYNNDTITLPLPTSAEPPQAKITYQHKTDINKIRASQKPEEILSTLQSLNQHLDTMVAQQNYSDALELSEQVLLSLPTPSKECENNFWKPFEEDQYPIWMDTLNTLLKLQWEAQLRSPHPDSSPSQLLGAANIVLIMSCFDLKIHSVTEKQLADVMMVNDMLSYDFLTQFGQDPILSKKATDMLTYGKSLKRTSRNPFRGDTQVNTPHASGSSYGGKYEFENYPSLKSVMKATKGTKAMYRKHVQSMTAMFQMMYHPEYSLIPKFNHFTDKQNIQATKVWEHELIQEAQKKYPNNPPRIKLEINKLAQKKVEQHLQKMPGRLQLGVAKWYDNSNEYNPNPDTLIVTSTDSRQQLFYLPWGTGWDQSLFANTTQTDYRRYRNLLFNAEEHIGKIPLQWIETFMGSRSMIEKATTEGTELYCPKQDLA